MATVLNIIFEKVHEQGIKSGMFNIKIFLSDQGIQDFKEFSLLVLTYPLNFY